MRVKLHIVHGKEYFFEVEDVRCIQVSIEEVRRENGIAWFRESIYEEDAVYVCLHKLPMGITMEEDGTIWIGLGGFGVPIWIRRESDEG